MSVEDSFKESNTIIQERVKKEIELVKKGESKRNYAQLNSILSELEEILNIKCLPLRYPRMIVDSWDYNDDLGAELLRLAELYKRWK